MLAAGQHRKACHPMYLPVREYGVGGHWVTTDSFTGKSYLPSFLPVNPATVGQQDSDPGGLRHSTDQDMIGHTYDSSISSRQHSSLLQGQTR
jgi:hypothetical protein